jgi:hypothetical protein
MNTKKQYVKPEVEIVEIDNEISLVLFSENEPPPDPEDF